MLLCGDIAHTFLKTQRLSLKVLQSFKEDCNMLESIHWRQWSREYIRSMMEQHRMSRPDAVIPEMGEIVLVISEKNQMYLDQRKGVGHIKGRNSIVRLHKRHETERPQELLHPLKIKSAEAGERIRDAREKFQQEEKTDKDSRPKLVAAKNSQLKTQLLLEEH